MTRRTKLSKAPALVALMLVMGMILAAMPVQGKLPLDIRLVPIRKTNLYEPIFEGDTINIEIGFLTVTVDPKNVLVGDPISVGAIAALPEGMGKKLPQLGTGEVSLGWEVQDTVSVSTVENGPVIGQLVYGNIEVWSRELQIVSLPGYWAEVGGLAGLDYETQ